MNFIIENIGIIISSLFGVGGIWGYLFERKKNKAIANGLEADADSKDIQNGKDVVTMYKGALDDLNDRYEKKFNDVVEMYDRKLKVLEDEIKLHKRMNTALKRENADLKRQLKDANNGTT